MFSRSRVGRVLRLESLTLVEAPAVGTVSLNLHLSRTSSTQSYGFKLKADDAHTTANSDPLLSQLPPSSPSSLSTAVESAAPARYRLIGIPRFLTVASRAVEALFSSSRGGVAYLSAVNGHTAADSDRMMRALMEGKDHSVELRVEGMLSFLKERKQKSLDEGSEHSKEGVKAMSEQPSKAGSLKTDRKRVLRAKTKLKSRMSHQAVPTEVAKEVTEANTMTPDNIDASIAKIMAEMLSNSSSKTDVSADVDDERPATKPFKDQSKKRSQLQRVGKKGEVKEESNMPAVITPKDTVDSHDTYIDSKIEDRTAAITQLIQRFSTLGLPSEAASAEPNLKEKRRGKKNATDQPPEEAKAPFGKPDSKFCKGKGRDKKKSHDKMRKKTKNNSKTAKTRRASSAAGNDNEEALDASVSAPSTEWRDTKDPVFTVDEEGTDSSGSFKVEL
ncbi:unnamed protein product [Phytomonas sp. Hart1]|nr:unnamed protein product [Phytomonas sp. Hart1]|eukprot:CCW71595.1 unnamed protein product [Phytomonas sp. isolate Hart1]